MKQLAMALFLGLALSMPQAWALDKEPFTQARFDELRANGELVLVDVFADWCSTCAKQHMQAAGC